MNLQSFRIVRELAAGSLGPIYLVESLVEPTDGKHGARQTVIKKILPQHLRQPNAADRLQQLVIAHAKADNASLVKLEKVTLEPDGAALLHMPFIDGESLASLISRHPDEAFADSLGLARDLAELLAAGQRAGLRHLALRPTQVLLSTTRGGQRQGGVYLLGLGLAEALALPRENATSSLSPHESYLAPEQRDGNSTGDGRADVYALGVLLLSLLLGREPTPESVASCRSDAAKLLSGRGANGPVLHLLQSMLALRPEERPLLETVKSILAADLEAASLGATFVQKDTPASSNRDAPASSNREDYAKTLAAPPGVLEAAAAASVAASVSGPTGALYGNFRIIRKLGAGGMGVVYEAEHQKIGRRAAVKVLHPEFAQNADFAVRFLNEARAVNIIRHPGLVEIFEYGQQPDGTLYIVMEFLQGQSLHARANKNKQPPTLAQQLDWSLQIARALAAAHEKGIIHRDLKPENVMLVQDPLRADHDWVKILDFGIAKVERPSAKNSGDSHAPTAIGVTMGTPIYMAPEQYGSASIVDGHADVFAFGVLLYELLAGKLPYEGSSLALIAMVPEPLEQVNPQLPKALAELVRRMMAIKPAERPTMAEVATALEAELTAATTKPEKPKRSLLVPLIGGALAVLVLAGAFVGYRLLRPLSLPEARARAVAVIEESLRSPRLDEKLQAARAIGKSRDISFKPLLEPLLADSQPTLAAAAARGLGDIGAIETQPKLLSLLASTNDPTVRLETGAALARLSHPKGLDALRRLHEHGDDLTRLEAALRLLEYGDQSGAPLLRKLAERDSGQNAGAVPVLAGLARTGDTRARQQLGELLTGAGNTRPDFPLVAFSLARLGDETARTQLADAASHAGPGQVMAARLLASLGEPTAYPLLLRTGSDDKQPEKLREIAFDGLADAGRADAAPTLARTFKERGASRRLHIAAASSILQLAAGEVGLLASRSARWTDAALGSDSGSTRELAVMLLGDLESEQSITPLRQALKDQEGEVRKSAAQALGRKTVRAALDALADTLEDSEDDVRTIGMQSIRKVMSALRKRGEQDAGTLVMERLRKLAQSGSAADRLVARGTLLQLGDVEQRAAVSAGLQSENPLIRRLAVELVDVDSELLSAALKDTDRAVQLAAARRAATLGSKQGVTILRAVVQSGGTDGLAAFSALKSLGEEVEPPPDLAELLSRRGLRDKYAVLDVVSDLSAGAALKLLWVAEHDATNVVRRRAAELAARFYERSQQSGFRALLLELSNDPDVIVRARVAELLPKLPAHASGSAPAVPVETQPRSASSGKTSKSAENAHEPEPAPAPLNEAEAAAPNVPGETATKEPAAAAPAQPESEAEQILRDAAEAMASKQYSRAQTLLARMRRLDDNGTIKQNLLPELYSLSGKLHESRQHYPEAMTEYMKFQKLPAALRKGKAEKEVKKSVARLSEKLGRIQVFTIQDGKCQISDEYFLLPGEHVISLGGGERRTVSIDAGVTTPIRQCP